MYKLISMTFVIYSTHHKRAPNLVLVFVPRVWKLNSSVPYDDPRAIFLSLILHSRGAGEHGKKKNTSGDIVANGQPA